MELYCQYQFNDDNFVKDIDEGRGVTEDQTAAGAGVPKGINRLSCEYHHYQPNIITTQLSDPVTDNILFSWQFSKYLSKTCLSREVIYS